jgi:PASTA domain
MLGFTSKLGSSKGMVLVPNLAGLTITQATTALQNVGLVVGTGSLETTSNSSLNGLIKDSSQSIASGTLVDYETKISFITYNYVYVPPAVYVTSTVDSGCQKILTNSTDTSTCSGYTRYPSTTYSARGQITTYYSDNTFSWSYYSCSPIVENGTPISNSSLCGYISPSCMPTSYSNGCTGCVNGYNTCSTTYVQSDCSSYTVSSSSCCSSTSTSYGSWSGCVCRQRSRDVTTTTTCGSSSTTTTTTQTASCTGGPC